LFAGRDFTTPAANKRFLYETPALGQRVRTCALLGNGSCPAQFRINLRNLPLAIGWTIFFG